MITDSQTNVLYLADTLPLKYPLFYSRLQSTLETCGIPHELLPGTKDVWAVDYMPVQVTPGKFVQFVYNPDYLQNDETFYWQETITDASAVCGEINIRFEKSNINLDGGNVVRYGNKVIMTEKVFWENPHYSKKRLIQILEQLFETDRLVFIPEDPSDYTGHADGMVRFVDEDTVLVNRYTGRDSNRFMHQLQQALKDAGLACIEMPYNPYCNQSGDEANGIYINYLQMSQAVVLPVFGMKEDKDALRVVEKVFSGQKIVTINSNDIARDGGVLNCISWNILSAHDNRF